MSVFIGIISISLHFYIHYIPRHQLWIQRALFFAHIAGWGQEGIFFSFFNHFSMLTVLRWIHKRYLSHLSSSYTNQPPSNNHLPDIAWALWGWIPRECQDLSSPGAWLNCNESLVASPVCCWAVQVFHALLVFCVRESLFILSLQHSVQLLLHLTPAYLSFFCAARSRLTLLLQ